MIQAPEKTPKAAKIDYASTTGWPLGLISRLEDDRTPAKAISKGENVTIKQNGTIAPRPGLKLYGVQPAYPILGQLYEFVKIVSGVPESWLICMLDVLGTGKVFVNKNGGAWTECTGKTYNSSAKAHFEQIANKVLIMSGADFLSYLNIDALTITPFVALTSPPTLTSATAGSGLTTSPIYTYRYRISATNSGETQGSIAKTASVNKIRDQWTGSATEKVTLVFPRVTSAQRYNIYVGDQAGFEYYIDTVVDPGSGTNVTYDDIGALPYNVARLAPEDDSTSGPKTTRGTNIKGEMYMTGDTDNRGRIWFGGTSSTAALDFSAFNGGGWVEPNPGGKDFPVKAVSFRDGKGTPLVAVLSKGTNGSGKRYLLQRANTTIGDVNITYMQVQEDNGQDGTDSPDGAVLIDDSLHYPSREAFKTSLTKAQIQNLISTEGTTDNISNAVAALSAESMGSCVGLANDRKIYWAVPLGSSENNQIWVMDLRSGGAWMRPWYIPASWMTLYADNATGKTKFLVVSNNQIYEFDAATRTNDNGVAFTTSIESGSIKFSEDSTQWGSIIDVTFIFLRPQGNITVGVTANTEDGVQTYSKEVPTTHAENATGFGAFGWGGVGWGNIEYPLPLSISTGEARKRVTIEVDEEVDWVKWSVGSVGSGVNYELSAVIVRYAPIGWKDVED